MNYLSCNGTAMLLIGVVACGGLSGCAGSQFAQDSIGGRNLAVEAAAKWGTLTHQLLAKEHAALNGGRTELTEEQRGQIRLLDRFVTEAVARIGGLAPGATVEEDAAAVCAVIAETMADFGYTLSIPTGCISDTLRPGLAADPHTGFNARRAFDCDTGTFLYLAVLEAIGQPACMVEVPGHNFLRLDLGDGLNFNWDVNDARSYTDQEFRDGRPRTSGPFDERTEVMRHYLLDMSASEVRAYHSSISWTYYKKGGRPDLIVSDLREAIAARPYATTARNNLAWAIATIEALYSSENLDLALEMACSAVEIEPTDPNLIDTLAAVHAARGEFDKAIEVERTGNGAPSRLRAYAERRTPAEMGWE